METNQPPMPRWQIPVLQLQEAGVEAGLKAGVEAGHIMALTGK